MAFQGDAADADYGFQHTPEVKNVNRLTLAFAKAVGDAQEDKADNLVVSPYNAAACLAMVTKGAEGQTREELAKTLFNTDGAGLGAAAAAYAALNAQLLAAAAGKVDLTTANGIWANKGLITLREAFAEDMKKTFGAEISAEKFSQETVDKINAWAEKNTNGLIKKVLEELGPDDAAVLASALHFKGEWTHKFDKDLTEDKAFTADGGAVAATPTMKQDFHEEGDFTYCRGTGYEAISMTYGKGGDWDNPPPMRLVLVRPTDDAVSARDFLSSQATGKTPAWLDDYMFQEAFGSVELPRLDIEQEHDLIPALEAMGIKAAFNEKADFTNMTEKDGGRLYISKVQHNTVFKTNEEGSEAAAVTTAIATLECARMPAPRVDFKLDRSFVFALQDVESGAVLFVGAVNKPNNEMKPAAKAAAPKI